MVQTKLFQISTWTDLQLSWRYKANKFSIIVEGYLGLFQAVILLLPCPILRAILYIPSWNYREWKVQYAIRYCLKALAQSLFFWCMPIMLSISPQMVKNMHEITVTKWILSIYSVQIKIKLFKLFGPLQPAWNIYILSHISGPSDQNCIIYSMYIFKWLEWAINLWTDMIF